MDSIPFYPISKGTAALSSTPELPAPPPSPLIILLLELNWVLMVQCFKISSKPRAGRASLPKLILNCKVLRAELSLVAFNYLQSC